MKKNYYIQDQIVQIREDHCNEFKGHKNISADNLPPHTKKKKTKYGSETTSRRAISRTLNSFLNTGNGGTVYLGILDNGKVNGITLTEYQKEHIELGLIDLFGRYKPPVKRHRYTVKFVQIYKDEKEAEECEKKNAENKNITELESNDYTPYTGPKTEHDLRSSKHCWCDKDAISSSNTGNEITSYIVEIKIYKWDHDGILDKNDGIGEYVNIHPIYEDEEGNSYFRREVSQISYNICDLERLARYETEKRCKDIIYNLEEDIKRLESLLKCETVEKKSS